MFFHLFEYLCVFFSSVFHLNVHKVEKRRDLYRRNSHDSVQHTFRWERRKSQTKSTNTEMSCVALALSSSYSCFSISGKSYHPQYVVEINECPNRSMQIVKHFDSTMMRFFTLDHFYKELDAFIIEVETFRRIKKQVLYFGVSVNIFHLNELRDKLQSCALHMYVEVCMCGRRHT